ncbi:hypothetical protein HID58_002221, partial [Brassica napus]
YRASVVSVFPCGGCCVDELWRLDNALRSRSGKTEHRHRGHFTFKRSHWSMHSTWKLWAQDLPEQESSKVQDGMQQQHLDLCLSSLGPRLQMPSQEP